MKRTISLVVFALIAVVFTSLSFAKEKNAVHEPRVIKLTEERVPQIVEFSASWNIVKSDSNLAKKNALAQANAWLKNNYKHVVIVSHSTSESSTNALMIANGWAGQYTVTILYSEK
jgi:hypothetical protein